MIGCKPSSTARATSLGSVLKPTGHCTNRIRKFGGIPGGRGGKAGGNAGNPIGKGRLGESSHVHDKMAKIIADNGFPVLVPLI